MAKHYIGEIDGLRAIAVSSVVLHHLYPESITGGFLGVDIFFVISGFLITRIIIGKLDQSQFSVVDFYRRRLHRIFPALVFLLFFVLLFGILLEGEGSSLTAKESGFSLVSIFNYYLISISSDYWGPRVGDIWTLHTWSLSIEEQFYLMYPALLCASCTFRWRKTLLLSLLFVASFMYWVSYPASSLWFYYHTPLRAWQLLAGGLVFVLLKDQKTQKRCCSWWCDLGIVFLLSAVILRARGDDKLGVIVGTFCAAIAIYRAGRVGVLNDCLKSRPLEWLGKLSYSIYLWHWPLLVLLGPPKNLSHSGVYFCALALASSVSYYIVERPMRPITRTRTVAILGGTAVFCIAVFLVWMERPQRQEIAAVIEEMESGYAYETLEIVESGMSIGKRLGEKRNSNLDLVLYGSSHARVYGRAVSEFMKKNELSGYLSCSSGLRIIPMGKSERQDELIKKRNEMFLEYSGNTLILCDKWSDWISKEEFREKFAGFIRSVRHRFDLIVVVGQPPVLDFEGSKRALVRRLMMKTMFGIEPAEIAENGLAASANRELSDFVERLGLEEVVFVEVGGLFKDSAENIEVVGERGFLRYFDSDHLTSYGGEEVFSKRIGPMILSRFPEHK